MEVTISKKQFYFALGATIALPFICLLIVAIATMSQSNSQAYKLTDRLEMGVSELKVNNLQRVQSYYEKIVGLDVLAEENNQVLLGRDQMPIMRLIEDKNLPYPRPRDAGLYHNAILFSTRARLANVIGKLLAEAPESYEGTADHKVSEAFYFHDPEGNGLELYFDKDRSVWQYQNGRVIMGSDFIDPRGYILQHATDEAIKDATKMGHVHLKIGDIEQAKKFYVDLLGFDITAEMPTALFVSVAGYHHHFGMNTWQSLGAGKREQTLGLSNVEIKIPQTDIDRLKQRLQQYNVQFAQLNNGIAVMDPWANEVRVTNL